MIGNALCSIARREAQNEAEGDDHIEGSLAEITPTKVTCYVDLFFNEADKDKNGSLSLNEFESWFISHSNQTGVDRLNLEDDDAKMRRIKKRDALLDKLNEDLDDGYEFDVHAY
eukprot:TRINITY_DN3523_c0_g1_i1.p1 TRINITY_DN3523_c0_g1~~TRINITY_DN3523_c0_g1_i1.p1  ORF type:complete len:114 (-),score=30.48 TRINITY_DN3523_c0_g1_i1:58-399(-)